MTAENQPISPSSAQAASNKELASSEVVEKPKQKKICCACPETKKERDECIVQNGEPACKAFIEMHKACLRKEGFDV